MDHEFHPGMDPRAWLTELGYVIAFRTVGWVECLIRRGNERWFGTGGDEAEAFANAMHAALPSEAARRAFEAVTRRSARAQPAEPAAPALPPLAADAAVEPPTPARFAEPAAEAAIADASVDPGAESDSEREGAFAIPAPAVVAPEAPVVSIPAAWETASSAPTPVAVPAMAQSEARVVERLSSAAAHAELDDLQRAIQENYQEASLLTPIRQRMLITQWMARARAIEAEAAPEPALSQRVYGIAQEVGKLAKVWWPGSVQVLAKSSAPSACTRDLDTNLAERIVTWRDVEAAAAAVLERLEDEAEERRLDDLGWVDAHALEPAPRDPVALLGEVRVALELRTSPRLLAPHEAVHTEHLKPALRAEFANNQIKWPEIAAKVRWLRGCPPNVEIWGAAMGRLRWLAENDRVHGDSIRHVLDPQFQPFGSWMRHLGVDKQERRRQRSAVVRRTPESGADAATIQEWLKDAFEFGDDLPNERIATLLRDLVPQVLVIPEAALPERKQRRRLKGLQALLREGVPPAVADTGPAAPGSDLDRSLADAGPEPSPSLETRLVERLRPYTVGRRVLFVSNRVDLDRDAKLQNLLGFSSIDPCLHEPARVDSKAQAIGRGTYDLVLAATGFLPHNVDGTLKGATRLAGIPYVRVNRGRPLQCLLHLAREMGIDKQVVA